MSNLLFMVNLLDKSFGYFWLNAREKSANGPHWWTDLMTTCAYNDIETLMVTWEKLTSLGNLPHDYLCVREVVYEHLKTLVTYLMTICV